MSHAIKRRLKTLEQKSDIGLPPFIAYFHGADDSDAVIEAAREKAVAKWEEVNGPLGDREPDYLPFCWL
jgi:hypothetical protein